MKASPVARMMFNSFVMALVIAVEPPSHVDAALLEGAAGEADRRSGRGALGEDLHHSGERGDAGDKAHQQVLAWALVAGGKHDEALAILKPLADKEDSLGDEPQGIPTREMVAEVLMMAKRPEQALADLAVEVV